MSLRPGGVTWIAVLFLVGAAAFIGLGIVCAFMSAFAAAFWNDNIGPLLAWIPMIGASLEVLDASIFQILGYVFIAVGAVDIVTSIGLLKLKKWGYWLCILVSIVLIVVIIGIVFIWYMRKDEVKAAFDIV